MIKRADQVLGMSTSQDNVWRSWGCQFRNQALKNFLNAALKIEQDSRPNGFLRRATQVAARGAQVDLRQLRGRTNQGSELGLQARGDDAAAQSSFCIQSREGGCGAAVDYDDRPFLLRMCRDGCSQSVCTQLCGLGIIEFQSKRERGAVHDFQSLGECSLKRGNQLWHDRG